MLLANLTWYTCVYYILQHAHTHTPKHTQDSTQHTFHHLLLSLIKSVERAHVPFLCRIFFFLLLPAFLQASFVFRWINCKIEIESHGKYYPSVIGRWFFSALLLYHSHARFSFCFFFFCSPTLLTTFPFRIRFDTSTNVNERMIFVQHNDNEWNGVHLATSYWAI